VADRLIAATAKDRKVFEYSDAGGYIDFQTKASISDEYDLLKFLSYLDSEDSLHSYIILKDIHSYLENPHVIARLKSIARKNMQVEPYNATIFIISTVLVIPREMEHLITIFDIPRPGLPEIVEQIQTFAKEQEITIATDVIDELALSLKGLNDLKSPRF
jgi:hypothetical protein